MPTLVSQIDTARPTDASAANLLANEVRAFKAQVKDLLLVIMNDNGSLKDGALGSAAQLGTGIVGSQQLGSGVVDSQHIAADAIEPVHMSDLSVLTAALGDLAVTTGKLADAAVTAAKLATDAVETAKIKDAAVTGVKIADGTIASAKIADLNASKLTDGSLTVAKFAVSPGGIRLPVIETTTAGSKLATIGGALSATLVADELVFTIGTGVTESGTIAAVGQTASGNTTAASYENRLPYSRLRGEALVEIDGNYIKVLDAGTFLVIYQAVGYSCGLFKVNLADFVTPTYTNKIIGTVAYAGPGQQASSFGCDLLIVPSPNSLYTLRHYAELTVAGNGQGLLVGGGGTDYTALITLVKIS